MFELGDKTRKELGYAIKPLSYDAFNYVREAYGLYEVYISKANNDFTNSIKYKILI